MPDCTLDRLYKPRSKMDHGARELERGQTVIFLRGTHVLLALRWILAPSSTGVVRNEIRGDHGLNLSLIRTLNIRLQITAQPDFR